MGVWLQMPMSGTFLMKSELVGRQVGIKIQSLGFFKEMVPCKGNDTNNDIEETKTKKSLLFHTELLL